MSFDEQGIIVLKAKDAGSDGKKTWTCFERGASDALLQGRVVPVNWENNGEKFGNMRFEDENTLMYFKGRVPYYFKKTTVSCRRLFVYFFCDSKEDD